MGSMVTSFTGLPSSPHVYLMAPPPLYKDGVFSGMSQHIINDVLPLILRSVVEALGGVGANITFIDAPYKALGGGGLACDACFYERGMGSDRGDGCHPVDFGYAELASAVCLVTSTMPCQCPEVNSKFRPNDPSSPDDSSSDLPKWLTICLMMSLCLVFCMYLLRSKLQRYRARELESEMLPYQIEEDGLSR